MTDIRRLGPGDEWVLDLLAAEDGPADGSPPVALAGEVASAYLADPAVWHWAVFEPGGGDRAEADDGVGARPDLVGHLHAFVHRIRHGSGFEVVLFDIAVRHDRRRRGIGRTLLDTLDRAAAASPCRTIWVLADHPGARAFYESCGYVAPADQPTYLERSVAPA